ncbi:hypothetical protein [Actinoplanes sp. HUAS TT8]|uniref:hypothetical protein n=1 Tax=Actinoplanes sp. HUAS TT8 TaxID=3447453 RepID=UPI003F527690
MSRTVDGGNVDIWGLLISALLGQLISSMMTVFGGEGGNRRLARTGERGQVRRRRSYLEVRVVWRRGGDGGGRASW